MMIYKLSSEIKNEEVNLYFISCIPTESRFGLRD